MYLKHCEVESRIEFLTCDIQEVIKSHQTIKHWAYILHDKDDTAPHYHIYLNFGNSGVDSKVIAGWFGLQESQVQRVKGRRTDILAYLIHGNDSQKNKFQYSPNEVISNFDFLTEIENSKIIGNFERYSYAKQLAYVNSLPISEKAKAYTQLNKLWDLHCRCLMLNPDRRIEVIFVHGKSGTGKTFYCKEFCKTHGLDYCVSSSSNDPFQDYCGQDVIILDDLRDNAFNFADLLKILDNNTSSSYKSRFLNKGFFGKYIFITSTIPLNFWYRDLLFSKKEDLNQLYRRFSAYVIVKHDYIEIYDQIDMVGRPVGPPRNFKNNLLQKIAAVKPASNFANLFSEVTEEALDLESLLSNDK